MKATNITGKPPGGERTPIADLVPLATPLVLQIFPVYACNFRCKYCTMSIPKKDRGFISSRPYLNPHFFMKVVDDCESFPDKIRVLRFVGMGEPLLHSSIAEMIHYASESNCFERIELITNGSMLTPELSEKLIDSGLTHLLISCQGGTAAKYKETSQVDIDFEKFVDNIRHFYDNSRGRVRVHIKIASCSLEPEEGGGPFFDIFGDICDTIGIEYIGPIHKGVKFNKELEKSPKNQYGASATTLPICSQPFYTMQLNPDGNVVPCYSIEYPVIVGNAYDNSIFDIWNNKRFRQFRYDMLDSGIRHNVQCADCTIFQHRAYDTDDLSKVADTLKKAYQ